MYIFKVNTWEFSDMLTTLLYLVLSLEVRIKCYLFVKNLVKSILLNSMAINQRKNMVINMTNVRKHNRIRQLFY